MRKVPPAAFEQQNHPDERVHRLWLTIGPTCTLKTVGTSKRLDAERSLLEQSLADDGGLSEIPARRLAQDEYRALVPRWILQLPTVPPSMGRGGPAHLDRHYL